MSSPSSGGDQSFRCSPKAKARARWLWAALAALTVHRIVDSAPERPPVLFHSADQSYKSRQSPSGEYTLDFYGEDYGGIIGWWCHGVSIRRSESPYAKGIVVLRTLDDFGEVEPEWVSESELVLHVRTGNTRYRLERHRAFGVEVRMVERSPEAVGLPDASLSALQSNG